MIITKKCLPRRTFIRGMGTTLSLPLLDSMVPALSALAKTSANPIRRLGFIYFPHGSVSWAPGDQNLWTPPGVGGPLSLAQVGGVLADASDALKSRRYADAERHLLRALGSPLGFGRRERT